MNREQLLDEWKEIEKKERKLKEDAENLQKHKEKFRLAEVDYVLENVRAFAREGKIGERYIDMYLYHCQNMLSGNIDGTVLSFNEKNVESEG